MNNGFEGYLVRVGCVIGRKLTVRVDRLDYHGGEGEGGGRSGGSELTATVVYGGVGFSKME